MSVTDVNDYTDVNASVGDVTDVNPVKMSLNTEKISYFGDKLSVAVMFVDTVTGSDGSDSSSLRFVTFMFSASPDVPPSPHIGNSLRVPYLK